MAIPNSTRSCFKNFITYEDKSGEIQIKNPKARKLINPKWSNRCQCSCSSLRPFFPPPTRSHRCAVPIHSTIPSHFLHRTAATSAPPETPEYSSATFRFRSLRAVWPSLPVAEILEGVGVGGQGGVPLASLELPSRRDYRWRSCGGARDRATARLATVHESRTSVSPSRLPLPDTPEPTTS